jgi:hypothetical protein
VPFNQLCRFAKKWTEANGACNLLKAAKDFAPAKLK